MPSYPEKYTRAQAPARDLEERRQLVLDRLTEAFAADLVPLEGYESRVSLAQNARDLDELESALQGLETAEKEPASAPEPGRGSARRSNSHAGERLPIRVDDRISGHSSVACVMGDRRLTGDWLSGDQVGAFTLMGSTSIDLRDTALPPGRLKLDIFVLMGETKIIVPRGLPVRMNAFPFMGEARAAPDVEHRVEPGQPWVDISGFALMGSIVVVAMD